MKKEYIKPTSMERNVCMVQHYMMVTLTGATTNTSANNKDAAGWIETPINVSNDPNEKWDNSDDLWLWTD